MVASALETVACPYCKETPCTPWAEEDGFRVVRCDACAFLYCNPRPVAADRDAATRLGVHAAAGGLDIRERRTAWKVARYRRIFAAMFADVWKRGTPITWLDIGAGYGEVLEALQALAPAGSRIVGIEPMAPKVKAARARGLEVIGGYLGPATPVCGFASLINIFSHLYDFDAFLQQVRAVLTEDGELFIETGDLGQVSARDQVPGTLGLPDHVAFASQRHLAGFLERNGFDVVTADRVRIDGPMHTAKNMVKKLLGRAGAVRLPWTSPYRAIRVRARKR